MTVGTTYPSEWREQEDPLTRRRVRQLTSDRPTVYLPTHDPAAVARLTQRQVVNPSSVRLPA